MPQKRKVKNLDYAYKRIALKLRRMLKAEIERQHLIDTGLLLESIDVYWDGKFFHFTDAGEYFVYVDGRFGLLERILNSKEFKDFSEDVLGYVIELQF